MKTVAVHRDENKSLRNKCSSKTFKVDMDVHDNCYISLLQASFHGSSSTRIRVWCTILRSQCKIRLQILCLPSFSSTEDRMLI